MTLALLLNEPLTIVTRTTSGTSRYGNPLETTASTVDTVGYLEQTDAIEVLSGRESYRSDWRCFLFPDAVVAAGDQIVVNGVTYEVIGQPAAIYNPRTRQTSHLEARLRSTVG